MPRKQLPEFYLEVLKALPQEKNSIDASQIVWDTLHRNVTPRCKLQEHGENALICKDASCMNQLICQKISVAAARITAERVCSLRC